MIAIQYANYLIEKLSACMLYTQLNVFLSRLSGEPIGFTVLGIFVIDKNTILTVGYLSISSVRM